MPLLLEKDIDTFSRFAIWDSKEEDSFFLEALALDQEEIEALKAMKPHRKKEWITSRFLLQYISQDKTRTKILKDDAGKPYRADDELYISLSHSKNLVAAIISDKVVGIDIQNPVEKIHRIQHKFISDKELQYINTKENKFIFYHILWGAKESMYKAYGKKELDFRKNMYVYPFLTFDNKLSFSGRVEKEDLRQEYDMYYEDINNNFLVYCILDK